MTEPARRVMVITAHPDDPEFGAGGTIAKLIGEGCAVTYVIVTNGDKGSSDRATIPADLVRIREDRAAQCRPRARRRARRVSRLRGRRGGGHAAAPARRHAPDPPVAAGPGDHPESHTAATPTSSAGTATTGLRRASCWTACTRSPATTSRFPSSCREHEPHQVRELYLIQWERPDLLVDVTETMELKLRGHRLPRQPNRRRRRGGGTCAPAR